ncbi:MAG: hypothetical protein Athens071426_102 [Parcubacteria group bacterium Athens0714_26]|nr:MAG: hypothetical protein Athens101426_338 [Parcubacteria group bacterium Athens1014_26]TSD03708.1 MAG: hypothetical protein Athens071426_102 [Parcubacteria group bacterium Athens0714_26]
MDRFKKFIDGLGDLDEAAKKKLLWILTPVIMVVIIALWLVYINYNVVNLGGDIRSEEQKNETISNKPSFFEVLNSGIKVVGAKIKEIFTKNRVIDIQGNNFKFNLNDAYGTTSQKSSE